MKASGVQVHRSIVPQQQLRNMVSRKIGSHLHQHKNKWASNWLYMLVLVGVVLPVSLRLVGKKQKTVLETLAFRPPTPSPTLSAYQKTLMPLPLTRSCYLM